MKLIDKDALVAELKERIRNYWSDTENEMGIYPYALEEVIKYVDTLEVKEMDEQKERMSECPYRQVGCTMYEGKILECNGACSWVVDYRRLKEFKAQKEE